MAESGEVDIVTSRPQPHTCLVTLNRPSKRNALSQALIRALLNALEAADADPDISVIVITGANSVFSAGADLKEIAQLDSDAARKVRYLENLCHGLDSVRKPIIAAVEGMALGGGFELALMCDMIVAASDTRFGFPEVNVGLIPGAGGTQRLTSIAGKYRAAKIILTGEPIVAPEAAQLGLISQLCDPGTTQDIALALAKTLVAKSSSACILAKESVQRAHALTVDLDFERSLYYTAFGTADKREGVSAFLEKRAPTWTVSGRSTTDSSS